MKVTNFRIAVGGILAGSVLFAAAPTQACPSMPYLGTICATAANFCPADNYLPANGQLLSVSSNPALFSIIGATYGGNGRSTFALPDLRGRTPVGMGRGNGLSEVRWGERRGIDFINLDIGHMPSHNHVATFNPSGSGGGSLNVSTASATEKTPTSSTYLAEAAGRASIYSTDGTNTVPLKGLNISGSSGTVTVDSTGRGDAFPNMPPQLGLTYCIANEGIYPSHP
ncbi:MAG: phage tail protein [Pseudomonadota bacterium]